MKLLAAKEEPRQYDGIDEDDPGGGDDIGWLMPAPAPAALSGNDRKTNLLHQPSLKQTLKRTSSSNSAFVTANLNHRTRVVEFGKVKEVKEKRDEINARKMKQSNGLKPFFSSSSLMNAHAQAQSQNESQEKRSNGSVMAKSLGARNNSVPPQSMNEEGKLWSTTLSQANGRISKRKAASPKKTTLPDGKGSKGRTLVLATPVKIRSKSSSSAAMWNNNRTSMAQIPELDSKDQRQWSGKRNLGKSRSLPAFVWGYPESGRGVDEIDEEAMDRGLGADSDEDGREPLWPTRGLLLVGETPQKGL